MKPGEFFTLKEDIVLNQSSKSINLKVSNTKQFTSTTIVGGQTSNSDLVQNPVKNYEGFDFRVQLDYVL